MAELSGIPAAFWRRQLRHDLAGVVSIAATTLVASFFVASAPRVLEHASAADLRQGVVAATPEQRNVRFELVGRIGPAGPDDPFRLVESRASTLIDDEVPDSVAAVVRDRQWVYDSPTFDATSYPEDLEGPFPTTFRFRYQGDIEQHSRLVDGRLPQRADPVPVLAGESCPPDVLPDEFVEDPDVDCEIVRIPVFEAAITQQTADDMMVAIDDVLTLKPDIDDVKWRAAHFDTAQARVGLRIAGIIELTDPTDEYWYADSSLHRPRVTENSDFRLVFAVGLMRPDQYARFQAAVPEISSDYAFRYVVDPDRVAEADLAELRPDLDKLSPPDVETMTGLPELIDQHLAQRRLSERLLSIGTGGVIASAVMALVVIAIMRSLRLRSVASLTLDRGGSRRQLRIDALRTGIATTGPPTVVGWALAWAALPDTSSRTSLLLAASVGVCATAGVVATAAPRDVATTSAAPRRLVGELSVSVLAIGAVLASRRRGGADSADAGVDLLVAATPALVAMVAGLIAVRLTGPVMGLGAVAVRRFRGLGAFVGFRRQVDQPIAARSPILMLTMAVATAVFSSVLVSSITAGQVGASWFEVGAEYRIDTVSQGVPLSASVEESLSARGRDTAGLAVHLGVRVAAADRSAVIDVVALDAARYARVLADAPVAVADLDRLGSPVGGADVRLPALMVGRWPRVDPFSSGDSMSARLGPFEPQFVVAAIVDRFPNVDAVRPTLIVDRAAFAAATDDRIAQATTVLAAGRPGEAADLAALADRERWFATVTARDDVLQEVAGDPLSTWTRRALWAIVGWSALLAAVAAVSAVTMSARARRRDLGLLRVLGIRSVDGAVIAAIEQVPTVVIALGVGTVVGVAAPHLVEPVLDFASFAAGADRVGVVVDAFTIVVLTAVLSLLLVATVAASVRALDRSEAARMLRVGDER